MQVGDLVKPNYETESKAIVIAGPEIPSGESAISEPCVLIHWIDTGEQEWYVCHYLEVISSAKGKES